MISVIGMLLLLYDEYVVCKTMRSRYQSFLFDSVVKWKKRSVCVPDRLRGRSCGQAGDPG